ncbi:MAG: CorA family divalent cation transporter [Christensenellales bacterium]
MAQQEAVFYRIISGQIVAIPPEQIQEEGPLLCYMAMDEFKYYGQQLGVDLSIINELSADVSRLRNSVDVFEDSSVGLINIINLEDLDGDRDRLLFVVMKGKFILVKMEDLDDSVRKLFDTVVQRYQKSVTLEKFIFGVLERFLSGGGKMMEELDHRMNHLEEQLVDGKVNKALNRTIYTLRQRLMLVRNYYEQLIDIGEELHENENELFDERNLHYFRIFIGKAERLANAAQLKSENLVHLREALDAELNYTLNNIMKIFTVLTAIFSPLTLIVGWYGMNFRHMPELDWPWAYPALFLICAALTMFILWAFRRKKLM